MPEQSRRVALLIFLFAIFIFLAVFIFIFSYGVTKGGQNYTETTSKKAIECVGYSFRVVGDSITYNNSELSFVVEPSGGGSLNKLVIKSDGKEVETKNIDFSASYKQNVKVNISVSDIFELSPNGCDENIKVCSIPANSCEAK